MTDCQLVPGQGFARLYAADLAVPELDLSCGEGWVLERLQIGFPSVRDVVRPRALTDGVFDDTRFLGSRAVSATLRFNGRQFTQGFLDEIMPYMSPRRRPTLTYSLSGIGTDTRVFTLRGVDAPVVIDGPSYQSVVLSWVTTDAYARGDTLRCYDLITDAGSGRVYDLEFDRSYGGSFFTSSITVQNVGNAPAPWTTTITADATDPIISINGVQIIFTGITLSGTDTIVMNVQDRTILANGDPTQSLYADSNYMDWTWDDLLLQPGSNLITYDSTPGSSSTLTICYYDTFI